MKKEVTYDEFIESVKKINDYKFQLESKILTVKRELSNLPKYCSIDSETTLNYKNCSTRLLNVLMSNHKHLGIDYNIRPKDLEGVSVSVFLKFRNSGPKLAEELKELCYYTGVKLNP